MKRLKVTIVSESILTTEHVYKETAYKNHKVQKVERRISECYDLSCGCQVPKSYVKMTKSKIVTCPRCTSDV